MVYYGAKELAAAFRTVRKNTITIATEIPEDKYDFKASPDTRSVRETLVHIALGTFWGEHIHRNRISDMQKVNFQELMATVTADQAKPRDKAAVLALLKTSGEAYASLLEGLSESFLAEPVTMMPGQEPATKSRFELLMSAKEHEMHCRGQVMVLQRMLGLVPHLTREYQERFARMQAAQAAR